LGVFVKKMVMKGPKKAEIIGLVRTVEKFKGAI